MGTSFKPLTRSVSSLSTIVRPRAQIPFSQNNPIQSLRSLWALVLGCMRASPTLFIPAIATVTGGHERDTLEKGK